MRRFELAGVRPAALIGMLIAVLVPVAVVAVLVIGVGGSKSGGSKSPATMVSMASAKSRAPVDLPLTAKTAAHYPLAKAVAGIDGSVTAKGMLPLRSCKLTNATTVTCLQPTPAVDIVIFRSYRSLPALYAAYEARVSQLAQGPFRSNFGNCTETMTNGEIGWNHDFKHPSMYPVNEFTSGQITDDKAAGRVYCTFEDNDLYLVWTQDDGRVLGGLSGAPHVDAYVWWRQVHHSIVMPGSPNMMMAIEGPTGSASKPHGTSTTNGMSSTQSMSTTTGMSSTTGTTSMR